MEPGPPRFRPENAGIGGEGLEQIPKQCAESARHPMRYAMTRPVLRFLALTCLATLVAGCQPNTSEPQVDRAELVEVPLATIPADACWTRDRVPAQTQLVYETDASGARVPREVELHPAEDRMFAVPCAEQMTGDFLASLQRALAVRGLHAGAITGVWDSETAEAVRRYQAPQGLDSAVLSLQAAQQLGLIAVPRDGF